MLISPSGFDGLSLLISASGNKPVVHGALTEQQTGTGPQWEVRMNSGAARIGARFVRFGFKGCPDVLGQLRDGRLLGVEVKAQAGRLRPEQAVVLERIRGAGGVAFVARDLRDVLRELALIQQKENTR